MRRGDARRRPRKDKGGVCRCGVCSVTGWSREGARRRPVAAVGRPPGRGRSEPGEGRASTPDGRSEDPPAGAGRRRRGSAASASRSPCRCCQACWGRGGEIRRRAPPRTRPSGPGRVSMSAAGHRPLPRPGRGPRRARPVPACAAPSRSAGPAGEAEAEPGFFEACHRRPLRSGARRGSKARTAEHDRSSLLVWCSFGQVVMGGRAGRLLTPSPPVLSVWSMSVRCRSEVWDRYRRSPYCHSSCCSSRTDPIRGRAESLSGRTRGDVCAALDLAVEALDGVAAAGSWSSARGGGPRRPSGPAGRRSASGRSRGTGPSGCL